MRTDFAIYGYAPLFAWLCMAAALYFAVRRPVANVFLPLAIYCLGGVPMLFGLTFARLSLLTGMLTVVILILQHPARDSLRPALLFSGKLRWFAWVIAAVSLKILVETVIHGLDSSRKAALFGALQDMLHPMLVLALGLTRSGVVRVERELLLGMIMFPFLVVIGFVPFSLETGLLQNTWYGVERFALGNVDTINSARILAFGVVGWVLLFSTQGRRQTLIRILALGVAMGLSALILLTGTRQYLVVLLVFMALWGFRIHGSGKIRLLIGVAVIASVIYGSVVFVSSSELMLRERVSVQSLEVEATESRGIIWRRAFQSFLAHPIIGAGFKNFGEETEGVDRAGNPVVLRDTAHGALQDVFTEHGVVLGFGYLAGCIALSLQTFRLIRNEPPASLRKRLAIGLFSMQFALLFSSAFLNATPVYLLLLLTLAWEQQGSAVLRPPVAAPRQAPGSGFNGRRPA